MIPQGISWTKTVFQPNPTYFVSNWGGFGIIPDRWECWQGGEHRLYDRFQYTQDTAGGAWGYIVWRLSMLSAAC